MASVMVFMSAFPVFAEGEGADEAPAESGPAASEASDLPYADQPMLENTLDSSKLPRYVDESDIHGIVDTSKAEEIESMFSDEAREQFSEGIVKLDAFEPVEDKEVALVLGRVENFLTSGGLGAYKQSGNLLLGSEIGLTSNKTDKVKILGAESNASSWVFVVDKDATCFWIKDEEDVGIADALVTISYLNDEGARVTKSTPTTGGQTPGIAVFDDLPDTFYGIVDIQAEGYHAMSILDKYMEKGERYIYNLSNAKEDELYIRGVDLSGKDMVNEETGLDLVNMTTEDMDLKVIVSKNGSAQFPDSIEIVADNRGETVLTVSQTSDYPYDSNTKVYTASKRWAEQNAGLFKDKDIVSIKFGSEVFAMEHLTVKNAVLNPGVSKANVPVTTKPMPGEISDRMGGAGWINVTADVLQVPVTFGVFPDGSMILMASYDFTKLAPDVQTKYSSLFDKSWNPKFKDGLEDPLQVFEKSFWENAEKVKGGKEVLNSKDKLKCLSNKAYNFSASFSMFLRSAYNEATDDWFGVGGFMLCGSLSGSFTEYFLFTAGPVVVPVYLGLEAGISVNLSLSVNFALDDPPEGEEAAYKWKYAANDGWDINARIEIVISFSAFTGVGVRGVMGAGATGFVNFDIATLLGKGKATLADRDPHSFIDVLYGVRVDIYLLFLSYQIKIECASGAQRLSDSWGEEDKVSLGDVGYETEVKELDLQACADELVPVVEADSEGKDKAYMLAGGAPALGGSSSTYSIDYNTYPDNQAQFAATQNCTALFRIISTGTRAYLMYQYQNKTDGKMSPVFRMVELPAGETRSVSEFVVVPNKTDRSDPNNCDKVYIGAILVDNTLPEEERMLSSDVAAIVVDLGDVKTTTSLIVSDPKDKGDYLYSAPRPAGCADHCSVAYGMTYLAKENGEKISDVRSLMGVASGNTSYSISWYEKGADGYEIFHQGLGYNKVYSSGVIAPNEPSFWTVDRYKSSDKYLVVKGYGANGYYAEDLKCNFRIDIDGMIDPADIYAGTVTFDSIITNWQYLNGCNYFIAGDSIYWMDKKPKSGSTNDYEWEVKKVEGGAGVISVDDRYTMITNNNQSAIHIIAVAGEYDVNVEESTSELVANKALIYTLTNEKNWSTGEIKAILHGPLALRFGKGDLITNFTAAYNQDDSKASGLSIVYSSPVGEDTAGPAKLNLWNQNADKGLLVTDVKIPDYLVIKGQPVIELYVTVRNYGYGRENAVPYTVKDENGTRLLITDGTTDYSGDGHFFTGDALYTGDSRVDKVLIRPNPDWEENKEHEIIVDIGGSYKYNGDIEDVLNKVAVKADNTTLGAENILVGSKHYVGISIKNNTITGQKAAAVKVTLDYDQPRRGANELQFSFPTYDMIYRFDSEDAMLVDQIYHMDIDMDGVWKEGLKNGLRGASFVLVDADGNRLSNEIVYLLNPAETRPDTVVGKKTDENGDPLEGATIGLFEPGSDKPLDTAVSDDEGVFTFYNVAAGEYIVKETEAPEGYALSDKEYTVSAAGEGETIELTISNSLITGSVKLTLTDEDDPEKKLSGATFTVWDGDDQVGTLSETSDGVYELGDLPYGEYTVKMETAPEGYEGSGSYAFSVKEDGATVLVEATAKAKPSGDDPDPDDPAGPDDPVDPDDKDKEDLPVTGDDSNVWLYGGLALVSLAAIAAVVIGAKKKKE